MTKLFYSYSTVSYFKFIFWEYRITECLFIYFNFYNKSSLKCSNSAKIYFSTSTVYSSDINFLSITPKIIFQCKIILAIIYILIQNIFIGSQKFKMQKAMIICNEVPTEVITLGRWIEEGLEPDGKKDVVVVIPGNPGIPSFYEEFIKSLKSKLPPETPIWILGYAGFVQPSNNLITLPEDRHLYDLKGQLDHKVHQFSNFFFSLLYFRFKS